MVLSRSRWAPGVLRCTDGLITLLSCLVEQIGCPCCNWTIFFVLHQRIQRITQKSKANSPHFYWRRRCRYGILGVHTVLRTVRTDSRGAICARRSRVSRAFERFCAPSLLLSRESQGSSVVCCLMAQGTQGTAWSSNGVLGARAGEIVGVSLSGSMLGKESLCWQSAEVRLNMLETSRNI